MWLRTNEHKQSENKHCFTHYYFKNIFKNWLAFWITFIMFIGMWNFSLKIFYLENVSIRLKMYLNKKYDPCVVKSEITFKINLWIVIKFALVYIFKAYKKDK